MKIRNGFVSNSSSSSFVVLLPDNFTPDWSKVDWSKIKDKAAIKAGVLSIIEQLKKERSWWEEQDEEGDFIIPIQEVLKDYIVAEMNTGPEAGQIVLADYRKVKHIVGE